MPDSTPSLLIVDDDQAHMEALRHILKNHGFNVIGFTSPNAALDALKESDFDLVLTDLVMPEMDGIEFLRRAVEIDRNLVGIMMTGHGAIETAVNAMKAGALDYILKPCKLSAILPVLSRALSVRRLRMENIQLRETISIYELSMALSSVRGCDPIVQNLADAAFRQSDSGEVAVLLPVEGGEELTIVAARGKNIEQWQQMRIPFTGALADWIANCREGWLHPEIQSYPLLAFEHPLHEFSHAVALPMLAGGKLIGVLIFASGHAHRPVSNGQVKALNILASAAGSALAGAQLLERLEQRVADRTRELEEKNSQIEEELRMARDLQMAMLPHRFPSVPRDVPPEQSAVRFYTMYHPAGSVSGDLFDVFPLPDGGVGVFIGDVMGHDVRAALITTMMRGLVQELSASLNEPGALLTEVNKHLSSILKNADPVMFATAAYLMINPDRSQVLFANAGHPTPLHLHRHRGEVTRLFSNGVSGPALGLFPDTHFKTSCAPLTAGDCIMLFTDGLFEVEDAEEKLFSQEQLQLSITRQIELPAERLMDSILGELREFSGEVQFSDDVCLVAVEVARVAPPIGEATRMR